MIWHFGGRSEKAERAAASWGADTSDHVHTWKGPETRERGRRSRHGRFAHGGGFTVSNVEETARCRDSRDYPQVIYRQRNADGQQTRRDKPVRKLAERHVAGPVRKARLAGAEVSWETAGVPLHTPLLKAGEAVSIKLNAGSHRGGLARGYSHASPSGHPKQAVVAASAVTFRRTAVRHQGWAAGE